MLQYIFKDRFPNLTDDNHVVNSPQTNDYNCIGYAAGDDERWWWPQMKPQGYWPPDVADEITVDAFTQAFKNLGYDRCENGTLVEGFEKVVLYVESSNTPTHMSRQLSDGTWTSKLGPQWDIIHNAVSDLDGPEYGEGKYYFSRKIKK